mgnify:CR=1 FL=1
MTIYEAAEYAQVNHYTIRRWINEGSIKAVQSKRTRHWAVEKNALDKFLENGKPKQPYHNPKRDG